MKRIAQIFLIMYSISFSSDGILYMPSDETMGKPIPEIPGLPSEENPEEEEIWRLEKTTEIAMQSIAKVVVPLEIISNVEINTLIIDNQKKEIPFELEMNKEPERKDFYRLKYTTTELDIDDDGQKDTEIYSPKFINQKVVKDNRVVIDGKNISKEGVHRKRVYITVEIRDVR